MNDHELIQAIKSLEFLSLDNFETDADDLEASKKNMETEGEECLKRYQILFSDRMRYNDSDKFKAAALEYFNDPRSYEKFLLASLYAMMGTLIKSVIENRLNEKSLECFEDCSQYLKNADTAQNILDELVFRAEYNQTMPKV